MARSIAQLRCIFTNAEGGGSTCAAGKYDIVAIKETWWEDLHKWKAVMDGYKLFRWDRQGKIGCGVALCIRDVLVV